MPRVSVVRRPPRFQETVKIWGNGGNLYICRPDCFSVFHFFFFFFLLFVGMGPNRSRNLRNATPTRSHDSFSGRDFLNVSFDSLQKSYFVEF